eukprot:CAMPEP_0174313948 /NCGR_PEP_ID=MMETSP0810-20121108/5326_1 /TAXON_ID=73025 ORGANISM="Eutreptiella gymnastica-like, Strain CCMP1594" /NCGR_SAMPLE_ID=MMETSP0810 /ASSEMBLY_ACC=CAM_ASM_000659 /LENGTH=374 /DNA_ID=CAMNT_0015422903 /DNA_START=105 /DNA_END=1229 /DNA_ORIENTATION=+
MVEAEPTQRLRRYLGATVIPAWPMAQPTEPSEATWTESSADALQSEPANSTERRRSGEDLPVHRKAPPVTQPLRDLNAVQPPPRAANATFHKLFLYLTQTPSELPPRYGSWFTRDDADVACVSWKSAAEPCTFIGKSTWTEGRNWLWQMAVRGPRRYKYYVFLDDDARPGTGTWRDFERALLKYEPALASSLCHVTPAEPLPGLDAQTISHWDGMITAFHHEVLSDHLVLPYFDGDDSFSWFYSQLAMMHVGAILWPANTLQINTLRLKNKLHRKYKKVRSACGANKVCDSRRLWQTQAFNPEFARGREVAKGVSFPPAYKNASYVLSADQKRRWLAPNTTYWRHIRSTVDCYLHHAADVQHCLRRRSFRGIRT